MTHIKELYAKWIHELREHMRKRPEIITDAFEAAGIDEACVNACIYVTRVQNPFRSDEYVVQWNLLRRTPFGTSKSVRLIEVSVL